MQYVEVREADEDSKGAAIITTGRIAYDEDHVARLAVPVSGRIAKVVARQGDAVKANQVLAVIHSPDVAAAAADLAQDRAQRVQADHALARAQRLVDSGAGSQREVEEARTTLDQAKAAEEKDQATLRLLGGSGGIPNPIYEVRAPIEGTVTERRATLGASARVDDASPLFVVADLRSVWVLVDVFEQDVGLVGKGAKVAITVPAYPDRTFEGEVTQIGDTVDATSRTVKVRIALPNADRMLKPEMFARVTVHAVGRGVARVPVSAVLTRADKTYVFVEDKPHHFLAREVVLGAREEEQVQVLAGVTPRIDRVVIRGGLLLDAQMSQRL